MSCHHQIELGHLQWCVLRANNPHRPRTRSERGSGNFGYMASGVEIETPLVSKKNIMYIYIYVIIHVYTYTHLCTVPHNEWFTIYFNNGERPIPLPNGWFQVIGYIWSSEDRWQNWWAIHSRTNYQVSEEYGSKYPRGEVWSFFGVLKKTSSAFCINNFQPMSTLQERWALNHPSCVILEVMFNLII